MVVCMAGSLRRPVGTGAKRPKMGQEGGKRNLRDIFVGHLLARPACGFLVVELRSDRFESTIYKHPPSRGDDVGTPRSIIGGDRQSKCPSGDGVHANDGLVERGPRPSNPPAYTSTSRHKVRRKRQ